MGGSGSGRNRWRNRGDIEDTIRLDVRLFQQKRLLQPGTGYIWKWTRGDQPAGSLESVTKHDRVVLIFRAKRSGGQWRDVRQSVSLTWTACRYGGERPWFVCPDCGRRAAILAACDALFLCRQCYKLTYRSQNVTPLDRAHRQVAKIEKRLGDPVWRKPKRMHQVTFQRLLRQLQDRERKVDKLFCKIAIPFLRRRGWWD